NLDTKAGSRRSWMMTKPSSMNALRHSSGAYFIGHPPVRRLERNWADCCIRPGSPLGIYSTQGAHHLPGTAQFVPAPRVGLSCPDLRHSGWLSHGALCGSVTSTEASRKHLRG